jgi:hypothetical protein
LRRDDNALNRSIMLVKPRRSEGGCGAAVGKHGSMKPMGRARNMAEQCHS